MSDSQPLPGDRSAGRVLVVDDEEEVVRLLGDLLGREGFELHSLTDPSGAVVLAKRLRPDLIILDLLMPQLPGTDLAVALKSDPRTRDIPLVFLSTSWDEEQKTVAQWSGAAGCLLKPWNEATMVATIRGLVEKARGSR